MPGIPALSEIKKTFLNLDGEWEISSLPDGDWGGDRNVAFRPGRGQLAFAPEWTHAQCVAWVREHQEMLYLMPLGGFRQVSFDGVLSERS